MFVLKVENESGKTITLTQAEDRFQVVDIDGLNPPNANIRRSEVAGMDGSKYASSKLEERNMVLTIRINADVELNRLTLYQFFRTKHWCKLYYRNDSRDVYIEGWVETVECDLFTMTETMQVSIICPDPYFQSAEDIYTDISQILGAFVFPFAFGAKGVIESTITDQAIEFSTYIKDRITTVYNSGADETGLIIRITATGAVVNPTIYKATTREFITIKITMQQNDVLTINTNKGSKSVKLLRNGVITSQINKIARDSTWLTLTSGDNLFIYEADSGSASMNIVFTHRTRYEGV